MPLEKEIRSLFPKQENKGFSAASTLGHNPEIALLDTTLRKGKRILSLSSTLQKPTTIYLRAFLKGIPLKKRSVKAQVVKGDRYYNPTLFYPPQTNDANSESVARSVVEGVEIRYGGAGFYTLQGTNHHFEGLSLESFTLILPSEERIYRHDFRVQSQPLIQETRTALSSSAVLTHLTSWPSGRLNVCPLLAYGGYYKEGLPLQEICQSFARISSFSHSQTSLVVKPFHQWKERGITPPEGKPIQGRLYFFNDDLKPEYYFSLDAFIKQGYLTLSLEKEGETFKYFSSDYLQKDPQNPYFDIIFTPNLLKKGD